MVIADVGFRNLRECTYYIRNFNNYLDGRDNAVEFERFSSESVIQSWHS